MVHLDVNQTMVNVDNTDLEETKSNKKNERKEGGKEGAKHEEQAKKKAKRDTFHGIPLTKNTTVGNTVEKDRSPCRVQQKTVERRKKPDLTLNVARVFNAGLSAQQRVLSKSQTEFSSPKLGPKTRSEQCCRRKSPRQRRHHWFRVDQCKNYHLDKGLKWDISDRITTKCAKAPCIWKQ